jgi:S1-C subfamily serine protease
MKARFLVFTLAILGGFYWVTTHTSGHWFSQASTDHAIPAGPMQLTQAEAAPALTPEEQQNVSVYKRALPAVVNITSTTVAFDFFYGPVPQQGQGSGFILDKQGHVLTNFHVVSNAREVDVTLFDKHRYKAKVLLTDKSHDLALLQIDAPNLQPATLADSRGLQVGQVVYAIGNPFGLNGTMTRGIISSIRSVRGPMGNLIEDAIQTDAAINPGNSGGPLLNSQGAVIGINSMIATGGGADQNAGVGFAIPINTAKAVLRDFAQYGKVLRPTLGVVTIPIGPDLAGQMGLPADYGVLIERVLPGGPADRAGLRGGSQKAYLGNTPIYIGGDLIVAVDGEQVTDAQDLSEIMDGLKSGERITVTIYRGQKKMDIPVVLGTEGDTEV